jgi:hypothetical protein
LTSEYPADERGSVGFGDGIAERPSDEVIILGKQTDDERRRVPHLIHEYAARIFDGRDGAGLVGGEREVRMTRRRPQLRRLPLTTSSGT